MMFTTNDSSVLPIVSFNQVDCYVGSSNARVMMMMMMMMMMSHYIVVYFAVASFAAVVYDWGERKHNVSRG